MSKGKIIRKFKLIYVYRLKKSFFRLATIRHLTLINKTNNVSVWISAFPKTALEDVNIKYEPSSESS